MFPFCEQDIFTTVAKKSELRGSLFVSGDAEYVEWLIQEFAEHERREASEGETLSFFDRETRRGWLGRTIEMAPDQVSPLFLVPHQRRIALVCRFLLLTTFYSIAREPPALSAFVANEPEPDPESCVFCTRMALSDGWRTETAFQQSVGKIAEHWIRASLEDDEETPNCDDASSIPNEWIGAIADAPVSMAGALCRSMHAMFGGPAPTPPVRRGLGRLVREYLLDVGTTARTRRDKNGDCAVFHDECTEMVAAIAHKYGLDVAPTAPRGPAAPLQWNANPAQC